MEEFVKRGQALWKSIYEPHAEKLYNKLGSYHPDFISTLSSNLRCCFSVPSLRFTYDNATRFLSSYRSFNVRRPPSVHVHIMRAPHLLLPFMDPPLGSERRLSPTFRIRLRLPFVSLLCFSRPLLSFVFLPSLALRFRLRICGSMGAFHAFSTTS